MRMEWPPPTIEPNWLEEKWSCHNSRVNPDPRNQQFYNFAKLEIQIIDCIRDGIDTRPAIAAHIGTCQQQIGRRLKKLKDCDVLEREWMHPEGYRYRVRPI